VLAPLNLTVAACTGVVLPVLLADQPRWDTWGRLLQPVLSKIPVLMSNGDHDINPEPVYFQAPYNTAFTSRNRAFNARWCVLAGRDAGFTTAA